MTVNTVGKLAFAALTLTALAGCVTSPPPAPAATPPVIVTTPAPASSPSVVVTPHAY